MEEEFVGVGDVFDVKQLDVRVGGWVEVLVHVLEHVLDANLLAVAHAPHGVECQAFGDGRLEDEDCCGATTADEVCSLRRQAGDGLGEHAVVVGVEQAYAVGPDEGCAVTLAGVEDALLKGCASLGLLAETG